MTRLHVLLRDSLREACESGNTEAVLSVLQKGPPLDMQIDHRGTALHVAAYANRPQVCELVLGRGLPVDTRNHDGETALHVAVGQKATRAFDALMQAGANVNARSSYGISVLHKALGWNVESRGLCERLLAAGADFLAVDHRARGAMHFAAILGNTAVGQLLLECGAGVDKIDSGGSTPLHEAARHGRSAFCRFLIDHRCPVRCLDRQGRTPLHHCVLSDSSLACGTLVEAGLHADDHGTCSMTPLAMAARALHADVAVELVRLGANPNGVDADGHNAVEIGCALADKTIQERIRFCVRLIAGGVDPTPALGVQQPAALATALRHPLREAARNGWTHVCLQLVELGHDAGRRLGRGGSAVDLARGQGHGELANVLRAAAARSAAHGAVRAMQFGVRS